MVYSAVRRLNSTLNLSGSVYFINNTVGSSTGIPVCGAAIFLAYSTNSIVYRFHNPRSIQNINSEAVLHFVNNTADCGGAIHIRNAAVTIGSKVNISFCENKSRKFRHVPNSHYLDGGAISLDSSSINTMGVNSTLHFYSNAAGGNGGAILFL